MQAPPPGEVTAAKPLMLPVTDYQEYTGFFEAIETVVIRARVRGFLREVAFREGGDVTEGDTLYKIDPREFQAALDKAKADEAKASSELKKAKSEETRAAGPRFQEAECGGAFDGVAVTSDADPGL